MSEAPDDLAGHIERAISVLRANGRPTLASAIEALQRQLSEARENCAALDHFADQNARERDEARRQLSDSRAEEERMRAVAQGYFDAIDWVAAESFDMCDESRSKLDHAQAIGRAALAPPSRS